MKRTFDKDYCDPSFRLIENWKMSLRIDIKCKVSIFSRLIEEDLLPGPCDLHIGAKEERKRRSIFESFFGSDDDTNLQSGQELEITGGFQLV